MLSSSLRFIAALLLACSAAGAAFADPAPITYAGQGGSVQTAGLAGGGENSYGYGSAAPRSNGAVIDLRRPATRSRPAPTPVSYEPPPPAAQPEAAAPSEQGAQPWLEREQVGPPYQANGRWYAPTPEPGYSENGIASWYGPTFHGQRTASGEVYDQEALTAAHPTLPLQSLVQVTNLENGREVIVRINDRGPFVGERLIDLSHRSAEVLGFDQAGRARVNVRYLGPAPRRVTAETAASAPTFTPVPQQAAAPGEGGPVSLLPAAEQIPAAPPSGAPLYSVQTVSSTAAPVPAAAAASAGGYYVQVGAFSDLANANRVRDAVSAAGPVSVDVRTSSSGMELFRVRVGPWASEQEAAAARQTLSSMGYGQTILASR
ncbi:MAG: septal ring lytic transglycosylase RlpA family protein [Hyphomonadaceae bacterium]|nr:septal ring lytic transglycosylase RlpA family protein [Hyphomonadaceae bacterium]